MTPRRTRCGDRGTCDRRMSTPTGALTTTLSVAHGTSTVAAGGGATVDGSGSDSVTLTGTLAQINTRCRPATWCIAARRTSSATDTLTFTTDDGGNTGSGGVLIDTDQVDDPRQHLADRHAGRRQLHGAARQRTHRRARRHRHHHVRLPPGRRDREYRRQHGDHRRAVEPHGADRLRAIRVHRRHGEQQ